MVTIQKATAEELDAIWAMVRRAVAQMNELGNPQWGGDYPLREDYAGDIARGELYTARVDGALAGVACINTEQSPEYADLSWQTENKAVVIHRMAVDPEFQRHGMGKAFFRYMEETARELGLRALRLDTYSLNDRMQRLILSQGFRKVGQVRFRSRPLPFPCFEKAL